MTYSNRPVTSYNRTEYCPVNTELKIIRTDGIVAIVESINGRFPCLVEMLSEELTVVVVEDLKPLRAPKKDDKDQLNLFGL